MKNILVIGGSYFAGRVLVEELLALGGCIPWVMNRGNRPLKLAGVHEIVCDRHDTVRMASAIPAREWHAVVDFCAYAPGDVSTVLQHLPGVVRRYIYISTATVLRNSAHLPMRDDAATVTGPSAGRDGAYAFHKWLLEGELAQACKGRGIPHVSLRPAIVYGKYNYAPRESWFFDLIGKGEPIMLPTPPQALFSMVSVWDLAQICIACMDNGDVPGDAWAVCADELVSCDLLIEALEAIVARKLDVRRQSVRVLNAAGLALPFPLEEHLVYSGARLQQVLSHRFLSLEEGMARTYEWYRQAASQ